MKPPVSQVDPVGNPANPTTRRRRAAARMLLVGLLMALCGAAAAVPIAGFAIQPESAAVVPAAACSSPAAAKPDALPPDQRIVLHRHAGSVGEALVSVGIPFKPGALHDPAMVRILDSRGQEVPAAVQTTLKWFFKDGSIRSVRVQFRATLAGGESSFYFLTDRPRSCSIAGWPYADGLVAGEHALQVPAVVATLSPEWLAASLVAGPQRPASAAEPYAAYVSRQFAWAGALPAKDPTAWLFDRPTALFKAYIRTGRADYLEAAVDSYRFYMKYIRRDGPPISPVCAGGWTYNDKPCDVKYVYVEPSLLALALVGDDSQYDKRLIDDMATLWQDGGWNIPAGPYKTASQYFTERLAGLGLVETVSAYELTGDPRYRRMVEDRIGWLYAHQRHNPDGLGDDGSWRNSWNVHENDAGDKAGDNRGSSPWMSENIIDGLWHAWLVTADPRIPGMIADFGRYLERYGWIPPDLLKKPHDWRNPCSGPDGQIAWYWSSAHATIDTLVKIQDSEGWYSDAHDVELAFVVAAAWYFETDPERSVALHRRFDRLESSYDLRCAAIDDTLRRFNWNNRGSGAAQWLIRQPAGSGAPAKAPASP